MTLFDTYVATPKSRNNTQILYLDLNDNLYDDFDEQQLSNTQPYEMDGRLEEDGWFELSDFSNHEESSRLIERLEDSKGKLPYKHDSESWPNWICCVNEDKFYFQKINPSQKVAQKKFLFGFPLGKKLSLMKLDGIIIESEPDAIYLKEEDKLLFRKPTKLSAIFPEIESLLYDEASPQQISDFLSQSFISCEGNFTANKVGKKNKRRITAALKILSEKNPEQLDALISYAKEYIPHDGHKFPVSKDSDLEKVLFALFERYYTTPTTQQKCRATSVEVISKHRVDRKGSPSQPPNDSCTDLSAQAINSNELANEIENTQLSNKVASKKLERNSHRISKGQLWLPAFSEYSQT